MVTIFCFVFPFAVFQLIDKLWGSISSRLPSCSCSANHTARPGEVKGQCPNGSACSSSPLKSTGSCFWFLHWVTPWLFFVLFVCFLLKCGTPTLEHVFGYRNHSMICCTSKSLLNQTHCCLHKLQPPCLPPLYSGHSWNGYARKKRTM